MVVWCCSFCCLNIMLRCNCVMNKFGVSLMVVCKLFVVLFRLFVCICVVFS